MAGKAPRVETRLDRVKTLLLWGAGGALVCMLVTLIVARLFFTMQWDVKSVATVIGWSMLGPIILAGGIVQANFDNGEDPATRREYMGKAYQKKTIAWDQVFASLFAAALIYLVYWILTNVVK